MTIQVYAPAFDLGAFDGTPTTTAKRQTTGQKRGLLTRIYETLLAAQKSRAQGIVAHHLAGYDKAVLERLGWTTPEIDALRRAPNRAAARV
jgi:hypothetical protein